MANVHAHLGSDGRSHHWKKAMPFLGPLLAAGGSLLVAATTAVMMMG